MTVRAWIAGILVVLSGVAGYLAHYLGGTETPESKWGLTCAPAWTIFEQKRRCGHVDLGYVSMTGTVVRAKVHNDGDLSLNVVPDIAYRSLLYYGGRKNKDYIHVEFMPCERVYDDIENVLQEVVLRLKQGENPKVRIEGRWSFDGVDHRGEWEDQVKTCLETRNPDPSVGWVEIHPAWRVEILSEGEE